MPANDLLALPWKPLNPNQIQTAFGQFRDWALCGGFSVDIIVGRRLREHADIDIGVFRSQAKDALSSLWNYSCYLCDPPGRLRKWDGADIPKQVYDIWVLDEAASSWAMQVMIFDDEGEIVCFKRDKSITWLKKHHAMKHNSLRVLNPMVTMLYKTTSNELREKDKVDISALIQTASNPAELKPVFGTNDNSTMPDPSP